MKLSVETWYEDQDSQGNCIACLRVEYRIADVEARDRLKNDIMKLFAPKPPSRLWMP